MSLSMSWIEFIYWASTIIGGVFFVLRTAMMVVGFGAEGLEAEADLDADILDDVGNPGDPDMAFKMLSSQGLTAFFLMFGLVGLATLSAEWPLVLTIFSGAVAGIFTVWVIGQVFRGMLFLRSEGNLRIENAIGQEGEVYLTIQPKSSGQVQVTVQGALKIFDAVAADGKRIATGEKIRVVAVVDSQTLKVEKTG